MARNNRTSKESPLEVPDRISRRAWLAAAGAGSLALIAACRGTADIAVEGRPLTDELDLRWCWCGGVTDRWATVVAAFRSPEGVELIVLDAAGASVGTTKQLGSAPGGVLRFQVSGLEPLTVYHYGFVRRGAPTPGGRFSTLPVTGAATSFAIAMGSCSDQFDNPVFRAIRNQKPLLFMHNGDLHYRSFHTNDPNDFREAYDAVLADAAQADLYRSCGVTYMWDDHDFGPNNSGHDNPSYDAVHAVYRERVPHYPFRLQAESRTRAAPILQAFSVGRVRFIVTDLRSEHLREPGSLMGARQRAEFFAELVDAMREHRLVVWMSSVPWNGSDCKDAWACAAPERVLVADFIKKHGVPVCIVSGDAHMVAIDDGRNTDYATGGGAPIPVFQAGSLGQSGSYKGGPYSHGACAGGRQFGLMKVDDDGQSLRVSWSARDGSDGFGDRVVAANVDAEGLIEYRFEVNADGALLR